MSCSRHLIALFGPRVGENFIQWVCACKGLCAFNCVCGSVFSTFLRACLGTFTQLPMNQDTPPSPLASLARCNCASEADVCTVNRKFVP